MTKPISNIIVVAGPTASGKSAIALSLAEKHGGVIINADSQQLHADLRLLTARPSPQEEARAPHKLYGIWPGDEQGSAGKWLRLAKMEIDWALSQGLKPILVGGTGLYLKALLEGIAAMPDIAPQVRTQASNDYDSMGKEAFAERLKEVDPAFFERLKVYDRQRLVRAYEVWLGSGKPLSWWQAQEAKPAYAQENFTIYVMDITRDELYRRCDERFVAMVEAGAVEEVKQLIALDLLENASIMKSLGVKELTAYIQEKTSLDQAITQSQQATRNYAKRQITWFRHQLPDAIPLVGGAKL